MVAEKGILKIIYLGYTNIIARQKKKKRKQKTKHKQQNTSITSEQY